MNFFAWITIFSALAYTSSLFIVAKKMKKRAKVLRNKIKKLAILQFIEQSVNLLSQSEFAELMREVSLLTNIQIEDSNALFYNIYERIPKIEKELKEILIRVAVANKIDNLAKDLESKARNLKISGIMMFLSVAGSIAYFVGCPYTEILSLMQYTTVGLMLVLPISIADSLKAYYESDKIYKKVLGKE